MKQWYGDRRLNYVQHTCKATHTDRMKFRPEHSPLTHIHTYHQPLVQLPRISLLKCACWLLSRSTGNGAICFQQSSTLFVTVILRQDIWTAKMHSIALGSLSFSSHQLLRSRMLSRRLRCAQSHIHTPLSHLSCASVKTSKTVMAVSHFI